MVSLPDKWPLLLSELQWLIIWPTLVWVYNTIFLFLSFLIFLPLIIASIISSKGGKPQLEAVTGTSSLNMSLYNCLKSFTVSHKANLSFRLDICKFFQPLFKNPSRIRKVLTNVSPTTFFIVNLKHIGKSFN